MTTETDRTLIRHLQKGIAIVPAPYAAIAAAAGVDEEEVLARIADWRTQGLIRRYGAVVSHTRTGHAANAMVAWCVPAGRAGEVGELFAARPEVSHCYLRRPAADWPYTLYTMVHATTPSLLDAIVRCMAAEAGLDRWELLSTVREFKKTTPVFFEEDM